MPLSLAHNIRDYYLSALVVGFILSIIFWMTESLVHVYIFHSGSLLSQLFTSDREELWMRMIIVFLFMLCSVLMAHYFRQKISLLNSSKLAYIILDSIGIAALITDRENKIIHVNQHYTEITGYTLDEIFGKNPNVLSSGKQDKAFYKQLWDSLQLQGSWEGELWNRKKSGELFVEWININMVRDNNKEPLYYVALFSDISFKKEAEEKMKRYAYFDPLTNLPNRRLFYEQLTQAIKLAKRNQTKLAILFVDLDNFKEINDHFGHGVGDEYLCKAAQFMKSQLRESDIISRFGGDEFVFQMINVQSKEVIIGFAEQLMRKLESAMVQIEAHQLFIKASIGCAIYPDDGLKAEVLIRYADEKMYETKVKRKAALL